MVSLRCGILGLAYPDGFSCRGILVFPRVCSIPTLHGHLQVVRDFPHSLSVVGDLRQTQLS